MADGFLEAAKDGNIELTREYIKAGFDVNYRSPADGTTALYWAACVGNVAICKLLLDSGADVNEVCNQWGSRPLHAAADRGHTDCVYILISGGADVNLTCLGRHDTALHKAAFRGHYHVCQLLLDRGADTDVINVEGKTPIQEAHNGRHYDVYQLILTYEKGFQRVKKAATELIVSDAKRSKAPSQLSVPLTGLPQTGRRTPPEDTNSAVPSRKDAPPDSGSSGPRLDDDGNSSRSGSAAKFYKLAAKYKQMEANAERLMTLLENSQLKLAVSESKNAKVEAELRATERALRESNRRLEATEGALRESNRRLEATQAEVRAARDDFTGHGVLADQTYRSRSVLADLADERQVGGLAAASLRQAKSGSRDAGRLLDDPRKAWRVGLDYLVEGEAELRRTERSSDRCTLLIRRGDDRYELKVYGPAGDCAELQKRCHEFLGLPGHENVKLPIHGFQMDEGTPPTFSPGKVQCLVYPLITTRLLDLLAAAPHGDTAVKWSESFFRFLLYGLLSGLAYLHRHQVAHRPVTCRDIYLSRDLMPVVGCLDPDSTPDGAMEEYVEASTTESLPLPPEVESIRNTWSRIQENDKETLMTQMSEKAEVFLLGHVIINVIFQWRRTSAQNREPETSVCPPILNSLSRDLRQLIVDMTRSRPEERISAEIGKIRLGLMMFGPRPEEVRTMNSYQIWHQVELMKLLMNCQQRSCTDLDSSGEYMRTIQSSLRHNDVSLRRDFLTSVPIDKQWKVYKTFNTVNDPDI